MKKMRWNSSERSDTLANYIFLTHFDIKERSSELSKMISMTVGVFQEVNKITSHYLIIIIMQTNLKALNF